MKTMKTPDTDAHILETIKRGIADNHLERLNLIIPHARKLERERDKAMDLLKTVHEWFMKSAPERYNGCGLWIDVDHAIREAEKNKQ
jgi:hypothetical protein